MKTIATLLFAMLTLSACSEKDEVASCCKTVINVDWEWANNNLDGKYWETTFIDCNNNVTIVDNGFSYYPPYEIGYRDCN